MAGPYKLVDCVIKINGSAVGVVESATMELTIDGGVNHYYGSKTGLHALGGEKCAFTLKRWYKTDTDTSLLYDLTKNRVPFSFSGEVDGVSNSIITLSNCQSYAWRPVMGSPNDIMAEEVTGEAVSITTGPSD
jgi:hypothetical protein